MKILDRYVIRSFLFSFVVLLVVLLAFRIMFDLFVNMDEFAEGNRPLPDVLRQMIRYYGCQLLVYFSELGSIVIVVAATFTLARMNHTNELTAILASGVSLYRVILPVVACSVLLSGLIVLNREVFIPPYAPLLVRHIDDFKRDAPPTKDVRLLHDGDNTVWYSHSFSTQNNRMVTPKAIFRRPDGEMTACIVARSAQWAPSDDPDKQGWRLTEPVLNSVGAWPKPQGPDRIYTSIGPDRLAESVRRGTVVHHTDAEYRMRIAAAELTPPDRATAGRWTLIRPLFAFLRDDDRPMCYYWADDARWHGDEGELSYWQLTGVRVLVPSDLSPDEIILRRTKNWVHFLSSSQLADLLHADRLPNRMQVRLARQIRFSEPILNVLMLLLVLPFIVSRERNLRSSVGLCLLALVVFLGVVHGFRYISLTPLLAAWTPVMVFTPLSVLTVDSVKT